MNILFVIVLLPFAAAALMNGMNGATPRARSVFMYILTLAECALCAVTLGRTIYHPMPWFGAGWGLLRTDGFQDLLAAFASVIWLLTACLPSKISLSPGREGRFYVFSLLTLGAAQGVFLSGDLMTAFVFFEIMTFSSYGLVVIDEGDGSKKAGRTYLSVSIFASMLSLAGLYLLYSASGTFLLSSLSAAAAKLAQRGLLMPCAALIAAGFAAKAGMLPLHVWLPDTYAWAPTSATILFSGVLSKVGVFGLMLLAAPLFAGAPALSLALLLLGAATMIGGGLLALLSDDLKRTLAYSSLSQIGFMLIGVAVCALHGGAASAAGAAVQMLNHGVMKFVLFACAGFIAFESGTTRLEKLHGAGRKSPVLLVCFLIAALGLSGVPALSGYIGKTLLHESISEYALAAHAPLYRTAAHAVEWLFIGAGGLTLSYMLKLFTVLFLSRGEGAKRIKIPAPAAAALAITALSILYFGTLGRPALLRAAGSAAVFAGAREGLPEIAFFSAENLRSAFLSLAIGALAFALHMLWSRRPSKRVTGDFGLLNALYLPVLRRGILPLMRAIATALDGIPAFVLALFRRRVFNKDDDRTPPPGDDQFAVYAETPPEHGSFSETLSYSFLLLGLGVAIALLYLLFH